MLYVWYIYVYDAHREQLVRDIQNAIDAKKASQAEAVHTEAPACSQTGE